MLDSAKFKSGPKLAYRRNARTTDTITVIATVLQDYSAGDSLFYFQPYNHDLGTCLCIASFFNSFIFDYQIRLRLGGTNLSEFVMIEAGLPIREKIQPHLNQLIPLIAGNCFPGENWAAIWLKLKDYISDSIAWRNYWCISETEKLRTRCMLDSIIGHIVGFEYEDFLYVLKECDYPVEQVNSRENNLGLDVRGFWRIDKQADPEIRRSVLSLVAYKDLEAYIDRADDLHKGIDDFCASNNRQGWMLPETLRLADYGLGHDDRAKEHQPVASRLGPRFYDWQLEQDPEESWRECELHARNLLGEDGFQKLMEEIEGREKDEPEPIAGAVKVKEMGKPIQGRLF